MLLRLKASTLRLLIPLVVLAVLLTSFVFSSIEPPSITSRLPNLSSWYKTSRPTVGCLPQHWNNGQWTQKTNPPLGPLTKPQDALSQYGLEGCASSREFFWHLGADNEEFYDRFPSVASWEWTPSNDCKGLKQLDGAVIAKNLVEQGGWLLIGDSVTEGHFFSLSCLLYPHVRATPNYTENPYFDRAWPQNLYLNPKSEIIPYLQPPEGFDIATTPLVTFRRTDYLLSQEEIIALHKEQYNPPESFSLYSEEQVWSPSPSDYLQLFFAPLPEANYHTLVVSTAGHWSLNQMIGFQTLGSSRQDEDWDGIHELVNFFRTAMTRWADQVQAALEGDDKGRVAVARAYLPGHEDCHDPHTTKGGPWTYYRGFRHNWWNWASIKDFNKAFEEVLAASKYTKVHYLGIEQPALLRPDGHTNSDCLHIATGPGIMEGWSYYIWHFVTQEVPRMSGEYWATPVS